jgi:rSAM/selenodomain-associated transferase 2
VRCVLTLALLGAAFRAADASDWTAIWPRLRPGWIGAALLLQGLGILLESMRWHLALRGQAQVIHFGATFNVHALGRLLGSVGAGAREGDAAKSRLYADWFGRSWRKVRISTVLDRLLSRLGFGLLLAIAFVLAGASHGWRDTIAVRLPWPPALVWAAFALGSILMGWWGAAGIRRWRRRRRLRAELCRSATRWAQDRAVAARGLVLLLLAPAAFAAVFACCLMAVGGPLPPWPQLAWPVAVVTVAGLCPVGLAGSGLRECVAVICLATYGVPAAEPVAAAVLASAIHWAWTLTAALRLKRETRARSRFGSRPNPATITVVIPALNEETTLTSTVQCLRRSPEIREIIVVDGGSRDRTRSVAAALGCAVLSASGGRGAQLRAGAARARGDVVLMVHADTRLAPEAGRAVLNALRDVTVAGGGLWKCFVDSPRLLRGSRFKCAVRLWLYRRVAGDQAMFVRRSVLERMGGVPDQPLMEEFALCDRLRAHGRLALAGAVALTSARRFRQRGVIRTYLLMAWIHLRYRLGTPPAELCRIYERRRNSAP